MLRIQSLLRILRFNDTAAKYIAVDSTLIGLILSCDLLNIRYDFSAVSTEVPT